MSESKKIIVVISVIVVLLLGTLGFVYADSKDSKQIYDQFLEAFNREENTLIYFGSETCGFCSLLTPSLEDMKERYGLDYVYFEVSDINSNYMKKILSHLGLSKIGTPYLVIASKGKIVDVQNGLTEYDKLFALLQENKLISEDAELSLNYIDYDEYEQLLSGRDKSAVVIGQTKCGYCVQAKLILNDIADEYDVTINYLNYTDLSSEEYASLIDSLDYFQGSWGTPVMFILQDGKMIDVLSQLETKENYIEFLEENGVL